MTMSPTSQGCTDKGALEPEVGPVLRCWPLVVRAWMDLPLVARAVGAGGTSREGGRHQSPATLAASACPEAP